MTISHKIRGEDHTDFAILIFKHHKHFSCLIMSDCQQFADFTIFTVFAKKLIG